MRSAWVMARLAIVTLIVAFALMPMGRGSLDVPVAQAQSLGGSPPPGVTRYTSPPVTPVKLNVDLRTLPRAVAAQGGTVRVVPEGGDPPSGAPASGPSQPDPVRQSSAGGRVSAQITGPLANFDGIAFTGFLPPDTTGDIGPNHFVQMVNSAFAIYDRAGTLLVGPTNTNTLFTTLGGLCATNNAGDPIVVYDQAADRFLLSQFTGTGPGQFECIAISQTANPVTGGFFLYAFATPASPDYPKIGVWPDAYYMSTFEGGTPATLGAYAFDRARMLLGQPATFNYFSINALAGVRNTRILPADWDGPTAPPAGAPNPFARSVDGAVQGGVDRLEIFEFHADFATPANATFNLVTTLNTAAFDSDLCGFARQCLPQPGSMQRLDALSNRLMMQLKYRNFGATQRMVVNQTVDASGADLAGIRWYELRRTTATPWAIFQQATYSPDATNRWMGSMAMNSLGEIALGYSVVSGTVFPGIRYTGRVPADPVNTLPQAEQVLIAGGAAQDFGTPSDARARWGDYSQMSVDPVDDCTFWYTQEYIPAGSGGQWRTRIGSFHISTCPTDLSITKTDTPDPVVAGNNITYTITVTNNGPNAAQNVRILDNIPANTTFVSATPSAGGACVTPPVGGTGLVTCTYAGATAVGATRTLTLVVNVNPATPNATVISNTATTNSDTPEINPANNTATATTQVINQADLSITKTDSPDPVITGQNITYTIISRNNGPSPAINVRILDNIPANTTFVSATPSAGGACVTPPVGGTGLVTCTFAGATAVGATRTLTLVVKVNSGTPNATTISNTATTNSDTVDPVPGNNSATATTFNACPDIVCQL